MQYGEEKRTNILKQFGISEAKPVSTNVYEIHVNFFDRDRYDTIIKAFDEGELFDVDGSKVMDSEQAEALAIKYTYLRKGFSDDLQKGKLNTSHLVLKEVNVGGKQMHRWVDPNKDNAEHAQHGSKVEFEHKGQKVTGTVGGVQKTGEYAVKLDKEHGGGTIRKHPHQFESPHGQEQAKNFATKTHTAQLKKFVKNEDADPALKKIAEKELENREPKKKASTNDKGFDESKGDEDVTGKSEKIPDEENPNDSQKDTKNEKQANKDIKDGKLTDKEATKETGVPEKEVEEAEDGDGDINRRFKTFERFAKALAKGKTKSLIAYGSGGVGKTHTLTKTFEEQGMKEFKEGMDIGSKDYDYVKITGKATPAAVFQALYEHNGKTIMFDDCDSVLQQEDAINIFKGALDTSGDGTISFGSQRALKDSNGNAMPSRFDFNGRVAFVSNLPPDKVPQPLKSRSLRIDMTMTPEQTIDRIKHIAKDKEGKYQNLKFPGHDGKPMKYSHEELEAAIGFLDKYKNKTSDLNVRTIGSILSIIQEAKEDGDDDWQSDAKAMILSKSIDNKEDEIEKAFTELTGDEDEISKSFDYLTQ